MFNDNGSFLLALFEFFLFFAWFMCLFWVFGDIFRSKDLGGVAKTLWVLFVIVTFWLGLLVYLLGSVDLQGVFRHFQEGDHRLFAIAVAVYAIVVLLSTVRWKVLLDALGGRSSFSSLTQSYLVSAFFANFLPSNVGGDVVRACYLDGGRRRRVDR